MKIFVVKITSRILRLIIAVFILEFLLLAFLIYRQQNVIGYLRGEIKKREREIAEYSRVYRTIPQLEETLNSMRAQIRGIEWELPKPAYVPTFLRQLERWARECNVRITNLSPQEAPAPPEKAATEEGIKRGAYREEAKPKERTQASPYEMISINLQAEGNYYAVQKFLDGFRRFPKALSLAKLEVNPQRSEGGAPLLRVSIFLNIAVLSGEMK
ncbi:MAG: type 4a pilus biogenesis protein PilO [bacterium]